MNTEERQTAARVSLEGLSLGDAFGERFFHCTVDEFHHRIAKRSDPPLPWRWTDDTQMAVSIVEQLFQNGGIDQDALAQAFARRLDDRRGYGGGALRLLLSIARGRPWRETAAGLFSGTGSFGNGGAMRVAPLGAYFADDPARAAHEATLSAEVTHAHPEGAAGAVAIAVAAAYATRTAGAPWDGDAMFAEVLDLTPPSLTKDGLQEAFELRTTDDVSLATARLGTGDKVSSQDTVPFCVWSTCQSPDDFEDSMWRTVAGAGDRDTTCAIVGGIVAGRVGMDGLSDWWLDMREALPVFDDTGA